MRYEELATAVRRGEIPDSVTVLKQNRVRCVVHADDAVLKVYLQRQNRSGREARAIGRAAERGLSVARVLDCGLGWLALDFIPGRDASREDVPALLPEIDRLHQAGVLHRDLHVFNFRIGPKGPVLLDFQKALFLPWLPSWMRQRELGYFADSLGEPLPSELESVRSWRDRRAYQHARHRTKRCLVESGGFTRFGSGFRRRDTDPATLDSILAEPRSGELLKDGPNGQLFGLNGLILKCFGSARAARRAWINANGLEARQIGVARALAVRDRWLVMEDAGATVIDWVESSFATATPEQHSQLADSLGVLLADLHNRGIYHADLKANNICWQPGAAPLLLDYGTVRFGRQVGARRRIKNLAQLNAALPDSVGPELRRRGLEAYLARRRPTQDAEELRRSVVRESLARGHRWTGAGCT